MNNSQEDLLEMTELSSPAKRAPRLKLKKSNQIHSPSFVSPARSSDRDVTSLFSVKKVFRKSSPDENDTETISEISEDLILSETSLRDLSKSENLLSSNMSARIKSSEKVNKLKKSVEKIRYESSIVDANVKFLRNKLRLDTISAEKPEFSFFKFDKDRLDLEQVSSETDLKLTQYVCPESLGLNMNLAQNDCLTSLHIIKEGEGGLMPSPLIRHLLKPEFRIQRGDLTTYCLPNQLGNLQEVVVIKNNILELCLGHIKFIHHPLFSLEHVLQEKLKEAYDKYYSKTFEENALETLKNRLKDVRKSTENNRVKTLRKLRENLFKEMKNQREYLKSVLNMWRAIKKLRLQQNYSSTNARLIIKKENSEVATEKEENDRFFGELLQDLLEEKSKAYSKKLKAKANGFNEDVATDDDVFDALKDKLVSELKTRFEESFRPPGEPKLVLFLKDDHEITDDVSDDQENDRRKVIATTKFAVKILCDNVPVCKTRPAVLREHDFLLDLNQIFSIQLAKVPHFLCLEVYEHPKGLLKKKIAELKVEVPQSSVPYGEAQYNRAHFERREIVHYKHAGVGSGYTLRKMLEKQDVFVDIKLDVAELHTKGILVHRIGWHATQANNAFWGAQSRLEIGPIARIINKWGSIDESQLQAGNRKELKASFGLDEFLTSLKENEEGYFRLNPSSDKMAFCKMAALQGNIRLQYLKLRDQHEIEFDGISIPNRVREIPFSLLKDLRRRKALEDIEGEDEDPGAMRDSGKRRLAQAQSRIFHACKGLDNNLTYESLVNEKYLIYMEDLIRISLKNVLNWFRWRPKLARPLPRIIKEPVPERPEASSKIVIKILCAKNVPQKKFEDGPEVRAFLEVGYEDFLTKTSAVAGSDPTWNELVELPLHSRHVDYLNPEALKGSISINLFDSTENPSGLNNERKFWLGEVKIPATAFTTGLNLSGWFKVVKPSMLLGYQTREDQHLSKSPKHAAQDSSNETYIQLDLTVSRDIPWLEPNMGDLPSNDIPYIKDHVIKWNDLFNSSFPNKKFSALVLDTKGRTNCITRYLRPLEPPQLNNEEFDVSPEQCLRYVSLIPFTECNRFYQNIWLTSDQFLSFMVGSVVDHCVTLSCFLLALKLDAYLLLGYGVPHGFTSYVLLSEYNRESNLPNYFILDVFYNEKFSLADPFCPLQRVFCIANGENVWGNAQRTPNPALLRFDLARRSDWWPLFDHHLSAPTNFVNNKVNFATPRDFEDVERQLERKLKRKFSKWRPMERTNFNHRVSEKYKNALRFFEMSAMYGRSQAEALTEVVKATAQYDVFGTILNLPFTNLNSIAKQVKRLNLHIQQQGVTDFGLSVFIQGYPEQVLSVWIFIGTVFDRLSS